MKITLDYENDMSLTDHEVKLLLKDALHEFIKRRDPSVNYLDTRYPKKHFTQHFRDRKFKNIVKRKRQAAFLKNIWNVTLTTTKEE